MPSQPYQRVPPVGQQPMQRTAWSAPAPMHPSQHRAVHAPGPVQPTGHVAADLELDDDDDDDFDEAMFAGIDAAVSAHRQQMQSSQPASGPALAGTSAVRVIPGTAPHARVRVHSPPPPPHLLTRSSGEGARVQCHALHACCRIRCIWSCLLADSRVLLVQRLPYRRVASVQLVHHSSLHPRVTA
jgi:hypothetical protein